MSNKLVSPAEIINANEELFNNTKVKSIKLFRAKFLDPTDPKRIFGLRLPKDNQQIAPVPFDIDDLDIEDSRMRQLILADPNDEENLKRIRDVIRRLMVEGTPPNPPANVLHWEGSIKDDYQNKLRAFIEALREEYQNRNKDVFGKVDAIRNQTKDKRDQALEDLLRVQNITQISSITKFTRNMDFNNELVLEVSLASLRELGKTLDFTPRENDALEVIFEYQDGRTEKFIGLVSGISDIETYGELTSITIIAFGFSKILSINKMVTDRAIVSQFSGEITEQLVTPWSTNAFALSSVSEIFLTLMVNQLAMKPKIVGEASDEIKLGVERSFILRTLFPRLNSDDQSLRINIKNRRGEGALRLANKFIEDHSNQKSPLGLEESIRANVPKVNVDKDNIESLRNDIIVIRQPFGSIPGKTGTGTDQELTQLADNKLLRDRLNRRLSNISKELSTAKPGADPTEVRINFEFDQDAFSFFFQEIYIPLITLAILRLTQAENPIIAKFSGKSALAFDVSFRSAYRLFFSQLNTPMSLLDAVKKTAKFFVYENEDNQIICEMPRYNEFVADTGENLIDFVIINPLSTEINRQDMNMISRVDAKMYYLFVGELPFPFTSRQYTDLSVLSRYGLRVTDPTHNPNARHPSVAALYAALEVTEKNALTRILNVRVSAKRKYKLGRLYFIARKSLEKKVGQAIKFIGDKVVPGNLEQDDLDGYIGYLVGIETTPTYGRMFEHALTFHYVRKAKLIVQKSLIIGANFKILPDISALIDALAEAVKNGNPTIDQLGARTQTLNEIEEADKIDSGIGLVYVTPDITTANTQDDVSIEIALKKGDAVISPLHSEGFVPYQTFFEKGVV